MLRVAQGAVNLTPMGNALFDPTGQYAGWTLVPPGMAAPGAGIPLAADPGFGAVPGLQSPAGPMGHPRARATYRPYGR